MKGVCSGNHFVQYPVFSFSSPQSITQSCFKIINQPQIDYNPPLKWMEFVPAIIRYAKNKFLSKKDWKHKKVRQVVERRFTREISAEILGNLSAVESFAEIQSIWRYLVCCMTHFLKPRQDRIKRETT